MKLLVTLSLALLSVNSYSVRNHEWELNTAAPECCTKNNGKLCGSLVVDCCKTGCQEGFFNSRWC